MNKLIKAVITCVFFASSLVYGAVKSEQANNNVQHTVAADKQAAPLVLKHAKEIFGQKKDGKIMLAWHESHSSHVSHESHSSHSSHASHYSGDY